MTDKEIEDYRKQFKNLGIPGGFMAFSDQIDLIVYSSGLITSGAARGYHYSKQPY